MSILWFALENNPFHSVLKWDECFRIMIPWNFPSDDIQCENANRDYIMTNYWKPRRNLVKPIKYSFQWSLISNSKWNWFYIIIYDITFRGTACRTLFSAYSFRAFFVENHNNYTSTIVRKSGYTKKICGALKSSLSSRIEFNYSHIATIHGDV